MSFSYPPPTIVTELAYDTLLNQRKAAFVAYWDAYRAAHPDQQLPAYTVDMLNTDPAIIPLQTAAGGDMFFIGRTNDVARAALLVDFAKGADLDLQGMATRTPAHPNGVARLSGELDDVYAARILEARAGSSAAGPDEWWLTHARAADVRVKSIGLYYLGRGRLKVTLLSSLAGGIPDQAMIDAVQARLISADVKPQGIVDVSVQSAVIQVVDVAADVVLHPDAPSSALDAMKAQARRLHEAGPILDVDLTRYYLQRILDVPGVYSIAIKQPASDLVTDPGHAYAIGTIDLALAGRQR